MNLLEIRISSWVRRWRKRNGGWKLTERVVKERQPKRIICTEPNISRCEIDSLRWQKTDRWNQNHCAHKAFQRFPSLRSPQFPSLLSFYLIHHWHSATFASILHCNQSIAQIEMQKWEVVLNLSCFTFSFYPVWYNWSTQTRAGKAFIQCN